MNEISEEVTCYTPLTISYEQVIQNGDNHKDNFYAFLAQSSEAFNRTAHSEREYVDHFDTKIERRSLDGGKSLYRITINTHRALQDE